MNVYGAIILITLIASFVLDLLGNLFNIRNLAEEPPGDFRDIYDPDAYRRSQQYTRDRTRLGILSSTIHLVAILAFWFAGGFDIVDRLVRGWGLGTPWTGVVFIGILVLARMILALPFSVYSNFVIEERYGFNKMTPGLFIRDLLKALLLALVLGVPLLAALLLFFDRAGGLAWLYCWGLTAVFSLLVQLIFPTWILPLFNKFRPLEEGELREALLTYATSVQFPMENVSVMDGSKRSGKTNAFFTGFGKRKRLALFDTLVEKHTVPELVAIFAHEVGHYKKRHILKGTLIGILHTGVIFFLLSIFISHQGLFDAFFMEESSTYAGFVFFGMLYTPMELLLSMGLQVLSRKNEYEADHFAAGTIDSPENMVSALRKLSRDNLANLTPHPFYVFLNYSHPPLLERIRAIRGAFATDPAAP